MFKILQGPERLEIGRRYLKYLEQMCVENLLFGLQESRGLVVASESRSQVNLEQYSGKLRTGFQIWW